MNSQFEGNCIVDPATAHLLNIDQRHIGSMPAAICRLTSKAAPMLQL
jgi:hypothetical protein